MRGTTWAGQQLCLFAGVQRVGHQHGPDEEMRHAGDDVGFGQRLCPFAGVQRVGHQHGADKEMRQVEEAREEDDEAAGDDEVADRRSDLHPASL